MFKTSYSRECLALIRPRFTCGHTIVAIKSAEILSRRFVVTRSPENTYLLPFLMVTMLESNSSEEKYLLVKTARHVHSSRTETTITITVSLYRKPPLSLLSSLFSCIHTHTRARTHTPNLSFPQS